MADEQRTEREQRIAAEARAAALREAARMLIEAGEPATNGEYVNGWRAAEQVWADRFVTLAALPAAPDALPSPDVLRAALGPPRKRRA